MTIGYAPGKRYLLLQGRGLIEAGLITARFLHLADICVRHTALLNPIAVGCQ
jgi:hypothetical protein